jgi:hypothetical protein
MQVEMAINDDTYEILSLSNVMPAIHPKRTYEQRDDTGFSEVSKDAFCAPIM